MPKLTLTSTFASTVMVGDPGYLTIPLPPKETKTVDVTDVQLRQLTPGLEKLKTAGWLNYVVNAAGPAPVEVKPVAPVEPPKPPPPPPAPEPIAPAPVEEPEPVAPAASEETTEEKPEEKPEEAPAPSAPKPGFFDRKNRNR